MSAFEISTDKDRLDRARVHDWISNRSYWARGRTRDAQDRAIDASRCFGAYAADGSQVGFARVVTDGVSFAWLCDVYVADEARGAGIGKLLVDAVITDLDALGVRRSLLMTADAHGLYAQYGFATPEDPQRTMVRFRPGA
ncbi:GNAT family N-acetyltransferase [Microbacterium gorillae]|uniref:GNAT family N-acetyltransferase n=1 Tax=Microbacterium gorillae TaxID=1231063 RepID=UPI00058E7688|nr:GNAT family N-acetyltransferase [Microbacterium gorillae]